MAFQPAFRRAFSPAFRPPFGASGTAESPLQQAVVAAWDMQEESGPLLPAKGGIEIPAFNSPGTAAGPASGITARSLTANSNQEFEVNTAVSRTLFDARNGLAIAGWYFVNSNAAAAWRMLNGAGAAVLTDANSQWSIRSSSGDIEFRVRQANGTVRTAIASAASITSVWRFFVAECFDSEIRAYQWDGSTFQDSGAVALTDAPMAPTANTAFNLRTFGVATEGRAALLNLYSRKLTAEERIALITPRLFSQL